MDTRYSKPGGTTSFDEAFETAASGVADSISTGLSQGVSEALADPIVQALMAADGVDRNSFKAMLRSVASKLADRAPAAEQHGSW